MFHGGLWLGVWSSRITAQKTDIKAERGPHQLSGPYPL